MIPSSSPRMHRLACRLGFAASLFALAVPPAAAQEGAMRGQASEHGMVVVDQLLAGLDHPWSLAFLPDASGALITERPGTLRLWRPGTGLSAPIKGVPAVYGRSQGGLLDVALA